MQQYNYFQLNSSNTDGSVELFWVDSWLFHYMGNLYQQRDVKRLFDLFMAFDYTDSNYIYCPTVNLWDTVSKYIKKSRFLGEHSRVRKVF